LIGGLARSHSVSVLSLDEPGADRDAAMRATREYCDEVMTVPNDRYGRNGVPHPSKRGLQLKSLLSPYSYERLVYHRPALQAALDQLVQRRRYDIINVEFSLMAGYRLPRTVRLVLDEHNIEYDILYRTQKVERQPVRKLYSYINYLKLRREERAAWRRFDGCVFTSARDEDVVRRDYPRIPTAVVPNAVDADAFRPAQLPREPMTLLFFGAMDYYPNTDGILYFLREIMPRLKPRFPSLRLHIVGQAPPEAVRSWASDDVIVTGFVDDVRPYLERASVVIVPLRIGGGTRLKIVEAMAMGKAIVSTTLGAEGIDVTDGENVLLADASDAFAAQVGRLLDDPRLVQRLGSAARQLVETRYTWQASVCALEGFYRELLRAR
jgi:glycosyltransferase involved in cell wall biosynthesis